MIQFNTNHPSLQATKKCLHTQKGTLKSTASNYYYYYCGVYDENEYLQHKNETKTKRGPSAKRNHFRFSANFCRRQIKRKN